MSDNVCVAVRLRPFNDRERLRDAKCCVTVDPQQPNTCRLTAPQSGSGSDGPQPPPLIPGRSFTFDHVFDSFTADPARVATQRTVWEAVGVPVLEAAWAGYNVSVFAYGQTGSGKSHSMVGFDHTEKGIIPNACEQLFQRIKANADPELSFRVECSMLEIYNERIRDLFVPFSFRPTHADKANKGGGASGLKLRDHPTLGVHVEGLRCAPVASYAQVERLMSEGTKNRTIAATNMNETSSRAHTIFALKLTSTRVSSSGGGGLGNSSGSSSGIGPNENTIKAVDRTSLVNLVDLAGSERQRASGAAGDRLKEAGAINRSLSALGNVISALAYNASLAAEPPGKRAKRVAAHASRRAADHARGLLTTAASAAAAAAVAGSEGLARHVPYRDSVLTHLLRNSLGGNARTTMLAAISPADVNFEETLSTLRYADRAKQIKNTPVVNEGVDEKLVRDLKAQVEALRAELAAAKDPRTAAAGSRQAHGASGPGSSSGSGAGPEAGDASVRASSEAGLKALLDGERAAMRQRLEEEMAARILAYEDRASALLEDTVAAEATAVMAPELPLPPQSGPHLANLNEDPALSGVLVYPLLEGRTRLGAVAAHDSRSPPPELKEDGPGCSSSSSSSADTALTPRGLAAAASCAHSVWLGGLGVLPVHACVEHVPNHGDSGGSSSAGGGGGGGGALWLVPRPGARCCVNGRAVPALGVALRDNDRLVLGSTCVLRVRVPSAAAEGTAVSSSSNNSSSSINGSSNGSSRAAPLPSGVVDYWEVAMAELNGELVAAMGGGGAQEGLVALEQRFTQERGAMQERVRALELELAAERYAMHTKQAQAEEEAAQRPRDGNIDGDVSRHSSAEQPGGLTSSDAAARAKAEAVAKRQVAALEARLAEQVAQTRALAARHELELTSRTVLDEQLLRALPLVHEANTISGELGKGMRFAVKLVSRSVDDGLGNVLTRPDGHGGHNTALSSSLGYSHNTAGSSNGGTSSGVGGGGSRLATEIAVLVTHDLDPDREPALWPAAKFHNRIFLMREVYQLWLEAGRDASAPPFATSAFAADAGDPFYDPPEDVLVGVARVQLEAVRWLLDVDEQTPLVDYRGARSGDLAVRLVPALILPEAAAAAAAATASLPKGSPDNGDNGDGGGNALAAEGWPLLEEYEDLADAPPGSGLNLAVHLRHARNLPRRLLAPARSLYVSFCFPTAFLPGSSSNLGGGSRRRPHARGSEVVRTARVPLPGGHGHRCAQIGVAHTLQLAVTPALVDFAATAALALEVWLSVDPPGPWADAHALGSSRGSLDGGGGGADDDNRRSGHGRLFGGGGGGDFDSEDSGEDAGGFGDSLGRGGSSSSESGSDNDEGLPPHGIAVVRNQPTARQQRRRQRQWQRQRQEGEHGLNGNGNGGWEGSPSPPHSPPSGGFSSTGQQPRGPTAAEYAAVVADAEQLRAANASLSAQLEQALQLVAAAVASSSSSGGVSNSSSSSSNGGSSSSSSSSSNNGGGSSSSSSGPFAALLNSAEPDAAAVRSAAELEGSAGRAAARLPTPAPPLLVVVGKSARSRSRERTAARLQLSDAQCLDRNLNGAPPNGSPHEPAERTA